MNNFLTKKQLHLRQFKELKRAIRSGLLVIGKHGQLKPGSKRPSLNG